MSEDIAHICTFLARLVACRSCSSDLKTEDNSNRELIEYASALLQSWGYRCTLDEIQADKWNLYADLDPTLPVGLLLSGHSDTVPAEISKWQHDPFKLSADEDRLYGLGACDMKGALACFLTTAQTVARIAQSKELKRSLSLLFTCEEETSMAGARAFAGSSARFAPLCIIGEPTSLVPVVGHKGYAARSLTLSGHSGHSSNPQAGLNALSGLADAILALERLAQCWQSQRDEAYSVPYATLNLGMVAGGSCINQICAQAKLDFEMRPLARCSENELNHIILQALAPVAARGFRLDLTVPYADIPALKQNSGAGVTLLTALSGRTPIKVNYCTEGSLLLAQASEVVIIGPGDIAKAHQPDEYVGKKELAAYSALLDALCARMLF